MSDSATPGWYHAEGDPPNTERYWDGAAWTEGPRPIAGTSEPSFGSSDLTPSDAPGSNMPVTGSGATGTPGASTDAPGGFSSMTPGSSDLPGSDAPSGFSSVTPSSSDLPGTTPGGFSGVTPAPDTPAPGTFNAPGAMPPATFGGAPGAGVPGQFPAGGVPGQFPGAPPAGAYGNAYPEKSQATMALVLSIVGALLCCLTAPVGAYLGYTEKNAIDAGRRDPANRGQAMGAFVVGLIVTGLYVLGFLFFILVGFTA